TRFSRDWSSDVCSSDLRMTQVPVRPAELRFEVLVGRIRQDVVIADDPVGVPTSHEIWRGERPFDRALMATNFAVEERIEPARDEIGSVSCSVSEVIYRI